MKVLRKSARLLVTFGVIIISLSFLLLISVLLFRNHLADAALNTIDRAIPGRLTAENIELVLLKEFPDVGLSLTNAELLDPDGATVLKTEILEASLDIRAFIQKNVKIPRVRIINGLLYLSSDAEGRTNLARAMGAGEKPDDTVSDDITDPDYKEEAEKGSSSLSLGDVHLENVELKLEDPNSKSSLHIDRLDLQGMVNRTGGDVALSLMISQITSDLLPPLWTQDRILTLDLTLKADRDRRLLELTKGSVGIDDAKLDLEGTLGTEPPYKASLSFGTSGLDTALLAAFLPSSLRPGEVEMTGVGSLDVSGELDGPLTGKIPRIHLETSCRELSLRHLPTGKSIEDFGFRLTADHDGTTPSLTVNGLTGHMVGGSFLFDAALSGKETLSLSLLGRANLDLEELSRFFTFPGSKDVHGKLSMDLDIREDFARSGRPLKRINENGQVILNNVRWHLPGTPYSVDDMELVFSLADGFLGITHMSAQTPIGQLNVKGGIQDVWPLILGADDPAVMDLQVSTPLLSPAGLFTGDSVLESAWNFQMADVNFSARFTLDPVEIRRGRPLEGSRMEIREFSMTGTKTARILHSLTGDLRLSSAETTLEAEIRLDESDLRLSAKVEKLGSLLTTETKEQVRTYLSLASDKIRGRDILPEGLVPEDSYILGDLTGFELDAWAEFTNDAFFYRKGPLPNGNLAVEKLMGRFLNYQAEFHNLSLRASLEKDVLSLEELSARIGRSDFLVKGVLSPASGLLEEDKTILTGDLDIRATTFDMNQLFDLEYKKTADLTRPEELFIQDVPDLPVQEPRTSFPAFSLNLEVEDFRLDRLTFDRIAGRADTNRQGRIIFRDTGFEKEEGSMKIWGIFDLSDPALVSVSGRLDCRDLNLSNLKIPLSGQEEIFYLSDHVKGVFTGSVILSAQMDRDMVLDTSSLDGSIRLNMKQGELIDLAPLEALATYFRNRNLSRIRFADMDTTVSLSNGSWTVPRTGIGSTLGYLEVEGYMTDEPFMSFQITVPTRLVIGTAWNALLGREKAETEVEDDIIYTDENSGLLRTHVNIVGHPENFLVGLGKNKRIRLENRYHRQNSGE